MSVDNFKGWKKGKQACQKEKSTFIENLNTITMKNITTLMNHPKCDLIDAIQNYKLKIRSFNGFDEEDDNSEDLFKYYNLLENNDPLVVNSEMREDFDNQNVLNEDKNINEELNYNQKNDERLNDEDKNINEELNNNLKNDEGLNDNNKHESCEKLHSNNIFNNSENKERSDYLWNNDDNIYMQFYNGLCLHNRERWILALSSLYPSLDLCDNLENLINQDIFSSPDKNKIQYMEPGKILKKKGHSINGPRREDIDRFNRKLFDSHSLKMEKVLKYKLFVNLPFYNEISQHFSQTILSADFVDFLVFENINYDGNIVDLFIKNCILVVHGTKECTSLVVSTENKIILQRKFDEFEIGLGSCKKWLVILDLILFKVVKITFQNEEAAKFVFEVFSKSF